MPHCITLIPGDGIGPEVSAATVRLVEASGVEVRWETIKAGAAALSEHGAYLPDSLLESLRKNRVGLKGPITTPIGGGFASINVTLRKALDLYANFRPVRNLPGVTTRFDGVDLVIFRENTEGLYSGLEHEVVPGVVESLKIITERASTRISRFAFEYARKFGRRKITCIHKANIMKLSDGLFLRSSRAVARDYPEIEYNEMIVDNACMQLVMDPPSSTCCCWRTCMGTSFPICARGWWVGWGWCRAPTWARPAPYSRRCTAAPRTSPGATSPTPRP
jgi:isocitrate dehydrogenase (NAD+)